MAEVPEDKYLITAYADGEAQAGEDRDCQTIEEAREIAQKMIDVDRFDSACIWDNYAPPGPPLEEFS